MPPQRSSEVHRLTGFVAGKGRALGGNALSGGPSTIVSKAWRAISICNPYTNLGAGNGALDMQSGGATRFDRGRRSFKSRTRPFHALGACNRPGIGMMSKLQVLLETAIYIASIVIGLWIILPMMSSFWLVVVGLLSVAALVGAVIVAFGIFLAKVREQ